MEPPADGPDTDYLATVFKTLSSSARLELLNELRSPKRPGEVQIQAERDREGFREDRALSRGTVARHLGKLSELDLVEQTEPKGPYVVNQQVLFSILQQMSTLARLRPTVPVDVEETRELEPSDTSEGAEAPRLVLVGGPEEGRAFPLDSPGPWTIGRGKTADLTLPYDPHVSRVHAEIQRKDDGSFLVRADPEATNPVLMNFEPLEAHEPVPFLAGSILAIGGSRLVLQVV